jgi:hypothetical protein
VHGASAPELNQNQRRSNVDQNKDIQILEQTTDAREESGLVEEHLTVEIPTEIQAGLRMPPCVYDCEVVLA